jgi:transcription factor E2F3
MGVAHDAQHSQKIPQDPSALHDFGGMTRISPSDVHVSQIIVFFSNTQDSCISLY